MDTIIVGAGVAGLACAGALTEEGRRVLVLDKGRGVGGRCATRRIDGQPVDHGVPFLHGDDPSFARAVRSSTENGWVDGWPRRIVGAGRPCMRRAFREREWRGAIREGVNAFPKALAVGVDVRSRTLVTGLATHGRRFEVRTSSGERLATRDVVIALPAPQCADLLESMAEGSRDVRAAIAVLRMASMSRCLTLLADYGEDAPEPSADLWLPERSEAVLQVVHDSAKRSRGARRILVIQGRSQWSQRHWSAPVSAWSRVLLDDVARWVGPWAAEPRAVDVQRWKFARVDGASEFGSPMLLGRGETGMMGIIGEAFSPGGGVQAAWRSGRTLARRIIERGRECRSAR